jgi:hypothetical protein
MRGLYEIGKILQRCGYICIREEERKRARGVLRIEVWGLGEGERGGINIEEKRKEKGR